MRVLIIIVSLIVNAYLYAYASNLTQEAVVPRILGEAPNYEERLAIAHVIRNRGYMANPLKGVYGFKASISPSEWQEGSRAWFESEEGPDPTKGATNWLSQWDLKHAKPRLTAFRHRMVQTAYIGSTHFYRERSSYHD